MGLLGMILVAVIVTVLLAIFIVKFVPLKFRWVISIILLAASAFLAYKIYYGIMAPIKFNKEKQKRYAKVIKNLKIIRDAEIAYKQVTGNYTADKQGLVKFIDTAKFALTETKNIVETVHTGGGITKEVEKKVIDTIGYEPVLKKFKNKDYKNMFKVPGTDKEFELAVGKVEKVPGLVVPVFEAKIDKESILKGMDKHLIKQELEAIETDQIKGAYVSIGSLEDVTTGGNWPPFYDKGDKKDK